MQALILTIALFFTPLVASSQTLIYPMQGKPVSFESLRGQWVIINYWASWCEPCRQEIPEFNRFFHHQKGKPIQLFAVNYDHVPLSEQKDLIRMMKIQYTSLKKDPAQSLGLGEIPGLPATFVFSPDGQLVKALFGKQSEQSLLSVISL